MTELHGSLILTLDSESPTREVSLVASAPPTLIRRWFKPHTHKFLPSSKKPLVYCLLGEGAVWEHNEQRPALPGDGTADEACDRPEIPAAHKYPSPIWQTSDKIQSTNEETDRHAISQNSCMCALALSALCTTSPH